MARRTTRSSRRRPSTLQRKGRAAMGRARKMASARKRQATRTTNRVVKQPVRKAARSVKRTLNQVIDAITPE